MSAELHNRKLVIFDLDGTLIDSAQDIINAQVYALTSVAGLPQDTIDRALLASLLGKGLEETFAYFIKPDQKSLMPEMVVSYRGYYSENLTKETRVFPGMLELVRGIKAEGRMTAIATTKFQPSADKLANFYGFRPHLDFVQAIEYDGFPLKPDPYILNLLIQKAGVTPEDTVMVGDTDNDLLCAQRAGISSVAVSWGAWSASRLLALNPDALATTPEQLSALLLNPVPETIF